MRSTFARGRSSALTKFRRGLQGGRTPLPIVVWIAGGILTVFLVVLIAQSVRRRDALISWRASLEQGTIVSWPVWDASWPPLPPRPRNALTGDLAGVYAFVARNAERLRFIPCYCGCAREGHDSVQNCFVKGFTPQGGPIWTDHAFTCPLCVSIVRDVSLMSSRGMSLPAIRNAIEEHHGSLASRPTPTPRPR